MASSSGGMAQGGATDPKANSGMGSASAGSGIKGGTGIAPTKLKLPDSLFAPGQAAPPQTRPMAQMAHAPPPAQTPQMHFSAQNPPMGVAPPPVPHPGVSPPYPDARSPQPTIMPNGQMVLPPPRGFISANMAPRAPATFTPGMTGLLSL